MQKFLNKIVLAVLTISMTMFPVVSFASVEIGDAETPSKFEEGYTQHNCVDLSEWNGNLTKDDFEKMKEVGIDSVILRAGFSTLNTNTHKKDNTFENNIKLAREAGFDVGIYYFSSALTEEEAIDEAKYLLEIIEPYKKDITLPVAYDFETNEEGRFNGHILRELGKDNCTQLCKSFCDVIEKDGYKPMVYASRNIFDNYLNTEVLEENYKIWLAQYTDDLSAPEYKGDYYIWQYTSSAEIEGIKHKIDANYLYTKEGEDIESEKTEEVVQILAEEMSEEVAEKIKVVEEEEITSEEDQSVKETEEEPTIIEEENDSVIDNDSTDKTTNKSKEKTDNKTKDKNTDNEKSESTNTDKQEIITYELDNSTVTVPVESEKSKSRVNVTDEYNFEHKYTVYKKDEDSTEAEILVSSLLTGYFVSDGKVITSETVEEKIEPAIFKDEKMDSIEDISTLLDRIDVKYDYSEEIDDNIYVNIKSSLAKGYPVLINISPNTINWNGTHMVLLLGMDESGKAIMADVYDRDWSKKNQRIKLVNVDEFISYTNGQYIYNIHTE